MMKRTSRRKFLSDLGMSLGALHLVRGLANAFPGEGEGNDKKNAATSAMAGPSEVDFRYAPPSWQSTFCFPDDPRKSLVGKRGELLYAHAGVGQPLDKFGTVVSFGLAGKGEGAFQRQSLESASLPIVTTLLQWDDAVLELTTFATRNDDEGRVDNVLLEVRGRSATEATCSPEVIVTSEQAYAVKVSEDSSVDRKNITAIAGANDPAKVLCLIDAGGEQEQSQGGLRVKLSPCTVSTTRSARYVLRFPQDGQPADKIKDGLGRADKLGQSCRSFWEHWKPFGGKVEWNLLGDQQNFLISSARNIVQSREIKNGSKIFQVGPTVYRGLWMIDAYFILEAARYLGHDDEVKNGIEAIWNLQKEDGSFTSEAGQYHWKDTAAPVLLLVRQAELTQDWTRFNELYPDAWKAMMYLESLREKAQGDGTPNSKYGLMPEGFGDSGIGGKSAELTNTIWALMAAKALSETADRFFLPRRVELRQLYTDLRVNFTMTARTEMIQDPRGFSYVPMLMKEDPQWKTEDPAKRPKPQSAQIYLSQLIYPGMLLTRDHAIVKGHTALMNAVTKEEIPAETGWLKEDAVWTYNAAVLATTYLWLKQPEEARRAFLGFLNHASPLYAWREEQSLRGVKDPKYIGDMPHNWASAECIRYLRHALVLEDEKDLRLLQGVALQDLAEKKPFGITSTPTRWGKVSINLEPAPNKRWRAQYKHEGLNAAQAPAINHVIIPRWLPGNVQLENVTGAKFLRNGLDVEIDPQATSWEAVWLDFGK